MLSSKSANLIIVLCLLHMSVKYTHLTSTSSIGQALNGCDCTLYRTTNGAATETISSIISKATTETLHDNSTLSTLDNITSITTDEPEPGTLNNSTSATTNNTSPATPENSTSATTNNTSTTTPDNSTSETTNNTSTATPDNSTSETTNNTSTTTPDNSTSETINNTSTATPDNSTSETINNTSTATPDNSTSETTNNTSTATPDNSTSETTNNTSTTTPDNSTSETINNTSTATPDNSTSETINNTSTATPDNPTSETPDISTSETPNTTSPITPDNSTSETTNNTSPATPDNSTSGTSDNTSLITLDNSDKCRILCSQQQTTTSISENNSGRSTTRATTNDNSKHPDMKPALDRANMTLQLSVILDATYTIDLDNKSSKSYISYRNEFRTALTSIYNSTPGFKDLVINGFSKGSIKGNFSVILEAKQVSNIDSIAKELKNTSWRNIMINNHTVNANRTKALQADQISMLESDNICSLLTTNICEDKGYKCSVSNGRTVCIYKCSSSDPCSSNGVCYVDSDGVVACRCNENDKYIFHGTKCENQDEKFALSKKYIIAISLACAGVLIIVFGFILIWICAKWRRSAKYLKHSDEKDNDRNQIERENSVIENVPLGGINSKRISDEDGNMSHGYRPTNEYVRINDGVEQYRDRAYYHRPDYERPDLGERVKVYQPSRIKSRGQDHLASRYSRDSDNFRQINDTFSQDMDERDRASSFYNMIDTTSTYMIKRPQLVKR